MSGTSKDDEIEIQRNLQLDVIEIPTHKKLLEKLMKIFYLVKKYALDYLIDRNVFKKS